MSLDGYIAGPKQSVAEPLGEGGEQLHQWVFKLKSWRRPHGMEGGETGPSDDILREAQTNIGAEIMGRGKFGGGPGPWNEAEPWIGWWGDNPPFHSPVYVLTHYPRAPLALSDTTFYFVTDGIASALKQSMDAAGGQDVLVGGGAKAAQQYLAAGLIDEMDLHVAPVMLGGGERLFENLDGATPRLELVRTVAAPDVVHMKYRIVK